MSTTINDGVDALDIPELAVPDSRDGSGGTGEGAAQFHHNTDGTTITVNFSDAYANRGRDLEHWSLYEVHAAFVLVAIKPTQPGAAAGAATADPPAVDGEDGNATATRGCVPNSVVPVRASSPLAGHYQFQARSKMVISVMSPSPPPYPSVTAKKTLGSAPWQIAAHRFACYALIVHRPWNCDTTSFRGGRLSVS